MVRWHGREELEGISGDVITTELYIELTEGDTVSKGSQSFPCITAVTRGTLSCNSREEQMRRMHSSDRTAGLARYLYIYLIEHLQPLPYVFRINGAQTVFRKTKLDHHLGYFLAYSIVVGCHCKFRPLE